MAQLKDSFNDDKNNYGFWVNFKVSNKIILYELYFIYKKYKNDFNKKFYKP